MDASIELPEQVSLNQNDGDNSCSMDLLEALQENKSKKIITDMLMGGASLMVQDHFGNEPIDYLSLEFLNEYLDNFVNIDKEKKITLDYRVLYKNFNPPGTQEKNLIQPILKLADHPKLKQIITHPVFSVYLIKKWDKKNYNPFRINLILFLMFIVVEYIYIMGKWRQYDVYFKCLLILYLLYNVIIELTQMYSNWEHYFSQIENYIELAFITFSFTSIIQKTGDRKGLEAFPDGYTLTLLFLDLFCYLEQHPKLSSFVTLYKKVLYNFVVHIMPYSILIMAFVIAFHSQKTGVNKDETDQDSISHEYFRTLIMYVGEISFENNFNELPLHYKIFFVVFLFCIPVVLNNLLCALAVSDIQKTKEEAGILELKERAISINNLEDIIKVRKYLTRRVLKPTNMDDDNVIQINFYPGKKNSFPWYTTKYYIEVNNRRNYFRKTIMNKIYDIIHRKNYNLDVNNVAKIIENMFEELQSLRRELLLQSHKL